jgi:hypothetical protein
MPSLLTGTGFHSGGLGILLDLVGIALGAPREEAWLAAFGLT